MKKRIWALIICICIMTSSYPMQAFAEETVSSRIEEEQSTESNSIGEIGGYLVGNIESVKKIKMESKFTNKINGHAFAAERGNNLIDRLKGKNATVVGDDNAKMVQIEK